MPTATPTMPVSEIGVSKQRDDAVFLLQPVGAAKHAAEVADILAEHDDAVIARSIITSMASRIASIMVMRGIVSTPMLLALLAQMPAASPCRHPRTWWPGSAFGPSISVPKLRASFAAPGDLLVEFGLAAGRDAASLHSSSAIR